LKSFFNYDSKLEVESNTDKSRIADTIGDSIMKNVALALEKKRNENEARHNRLVKCVTSAQIIAI